MTKFSRFGNDLNKNVRNKSTHEINLTGDVGGSGIIKSLERSLSVDHAQYEVLTQFHIAHWNTLDSVDEIAIFEYLSLCLRLKGESNEKIV